MTYGIRLDDLVDITDAVGQMIDSERAADEAAIRFMLGRWVSEAEPVLVYYGATLLGLTFAGIPLGVEAPICVRPPRGRYYFSPPPDRYRFSTRMERP